jgi:RNA polymerase sigma-54 factor
VQQEERDDFPLENFARTSSSLADHLDDQLRLTTDDGRLRAVGVAIIGNIDEAGYLRAEPEDIAQKTGASREEVEAALALIQSFDPPGIAARTPQECLLLQLRADPMPDPVAVEIVEGHFDALEHRRYAELAKTLKLPLERIMEAVEEIQALEPKPGRKFAEVETRYITPDVFVYKMGDDYTVVLNEDGVPRLRVNSLYRSLLRGSGSDARQYVEQKLRSAVWLIKSVYQRQRTLLRVTQSIVKFQRAFLDKGLSFLRPLTLRDVGDDIGMHESTISRVTTNKYVHTPQGLFELKYFFHRGVPVTSGAETASSLKVKELVRQLLTVEDSGKPLSDQKIVEVLRAQHDIDIARRTVAKYRSQLKIPSSSRRKRY